MQPPSHSLPYEPVHKSVEDYVSSLLNFVTTSSLHRALCGGVHVADFLIREPDLYSSLLPSSWATWLTQVSIYDTIDLLIREDLDAVRNPHTTWRSYPVPPETLLEFIAQVRNHSLNRVYTGADSARSIAKLDLQIAVGMNAKKKHEVENFAAFVAELADQINEGIEQDTVRAEHSITHLVDFGSGQNYLGRVLAGPMYMRNVVGLESRSRNISEARKLDAHAKLADRTRIWRNKKMWKAEGRDTAEIERQAALVHGVDSGTDGVDAIYSRADSFQNKVPDEVRRRITYVEHIINDGDLAAVVRQLQNSSDHDVVPTTHKQTPKLMVMSLHSCGNLVHHGLRSLVLNPAVKAVAMIGCCYNLCTERLGTPTLKVPNLQLRSPNQRLEGTSGACDPDGFPMSKRFLEYQHAKGPGIKFNITARMMAVQAVANWTRAECEAFFTRHFYRSLLQRVFFDIGFFNPLASVGGEEDNIESSKTETIEPVIIGRLTKSCYQSFVAYVRGAVQKVVKFNPKRGPRLTECMERLTDDDIAEYERRYMHKRHQLCVIWTLMAFAAQVVESAIVVDRWQFLREQDEVAMAWVQTVFEYQESPRNLVVVGIKK